MAQGAAHNTQVSHSPKTISGQRSSMHSVHTAGGIPTDAADWVVSNSRGGSQRRDSTELSISQNLTSPPQKQALSSASVKS